MQHKMSLSNYAHQLYVLPIKCLNFPFYLSDAKSFTSLLLNIIIKWIFVYGESKVCDLSEASELNVACSTLLIGQMMEMVLLV